MVLEGLLVAIFPSSLMLHIGAMFKPLEKLLERAGLPIGSGTRDLIGVGIFMTYLAIPQFLGAVIGGLFMSRFRIKLVIERRVDKPTDLAPQMVEVVPAQ
jgi:hypothetical protein